MQNTKRNFKVNVVWIDIRLADEAEKVITMKQNFFQIACFEFFKFNYTETKLKNKKPFLFVEFLTCTTAMLTFFIKNT